MKPKAAGWSGTVAAMLASALAMNAAAQADEDAESMVELAWDSGCFNCHDLDETVRGPAWRDVAERYRADEQAFTMLREKVREGGAGNWGEDRMSPNRRVPVEDIDRLVRWLLTLESRVDSTDRP